MKNAAKKTTPSLLTPAIGLGEKQRAAIARLLETSLGSTYVLQVQTQSCHWNVTGPEFASLHPLFAEQYDALAEAVDELAERIRALGFAAPGTLRAFLKLSAIEEDAVLPVGAQAMIARLLQSHEAAARFYRKSIPLVQAEGDEITADLFIERGTYHEKTAWMLRSLSL